MYCIYEISYASIVAFVYTDTKLVKSEKSYTLKALSKVENNNFQDDAIIIGPSKIAGSKNYEFSYY